MRIVLPERISFKGAGLGNEIAPWAKAFLAAQAAGARYLRPAWGLNPRKYRKFFGSSRLDWIGQLLLDRGTARHRFTEDDYLAAGEEDFGEAFRIWTESKGLSEKRHWVVRVGGMWGGYWALRRARPYLLAELGRTRFTQENLAGFASEIDPRKLLCVVHLRGGDFGGDGESIRGKFNIRLPYAWYESALKATLEAFEGRLTVVFLTNDASARVTAMRDEYGALTTGRWRHTDISDLLIMAQADIVIPSISSFSNLAIFLNPQAHYFWPRDHLTGIDSDAGLYGIWGFEEGQRRPGSPSIRMAGHSGERETGRAMAHGIGDPFPAPQADRLRDRLSARSRHSDLIYFGSLPLHPSPVDRNA